MALLGLGSVSASHAATSKPAANVNFVTPEYADGRFAGLQDRDY
ncbi:hypothetical protein [Hymenobacter wooponensis]|nr:hypothetical protein [Hymenobacter wooponensis]